MKHPIGLQARDVFIKKQVALSLLPFFYVNGFGYGLAVYSDEPKFGDIVINV